MPRNRQDAAPEGADGKSAVAETAAPSAAQVAGYLRRNPDFLTENAELLEAMTPPSRTSGDGVLDLQYFMVERLREQIAELSRARDDLVQTGRGNLASQARVHQAVLALLAATSFEHLIEIATTDLAVMLDLDAVALGVERTDYDLPRVRLGGLIQLEPDTVDHQIGPGRRVLLRTEIDGDPAVFGAGAGLVASEALVRLDISAATPSAMLALGSRQPEHFHPGQATELLVFLADTLQHCIRMWLDLPE